jgi:hypothetical protein
MISSRAELQIGCWAEGLLERMMGRRVYRKMGLQLLEITGRSDSMPFGLQAR